MKRLGGRIPDQRVKCINKTITDTHTRWSYTSTFMISNNLNLSTISINPFLEFCPGGLYNISSVFLVTGTPIDVLNFFKLTHTHTHTHTELVAEHIHWLNEKNFHLTNGYGTPPIQSFSYSISTLFIIQGFQTIVFIFVIVATFQSICSPAFRCFLSNLGPYMELRTTSFI